METNDRVRGASIAAHNHICTLHQNGSVRKCWGTLRNGAVCRNRATWRAARKVLPTCKIHRRQVKQAAWCKALLNCGFNCGKLVEWAPHKFQLCPQHREYLTGSYFLELPLEIRCRIYRLLLPDASIPARFCNCAFHKEYYYTAILRVNRQIHEEATQVLYSTSIFSVAVSEVRLGMCNLPNSYEQDYEAQCLVLEQSQANRGVEPGSSSTLPPLTELVWNPPISERYFTMIRSFQIEILVHNPLGPFSTSNPDSLTALNLSRLCDKLHLLVARLRLRKHPIARLKITIKFLNARVGPSRSLKTTQLFPAIRTLLNPFRRLCQIGSAEVLSVTINDSRGSEIDILFPGRIDPVTRNALDEHLKQWCQDLSSSQVSPRFVLILEDYWRLANVISHITDRHGADPKMWQFAELLATAKTARENGSLQSLRRAWNHLVALWLSHLDDHDAFASRIMTLMLAPSMCR